jgi:hypothetical protein
MSLALAFKRRESARFGPASTRDAEFVAVLNTRGDCIQPPNVRALLHSGVGAAHVDKTLRRSRHGTRGTATIQVPRWSGRCYRFVRFRSEPTSVRLAPNSNRSLGDDCDDPQGAVSSADHHFNGAAPAVWAPPCGSLIVSTFGYAWFPPFHGV